MVITATNNAAGGHPVSLDNLEKTRALSGSAGIPLFLDAPPDKRLRRRRRGFLGACA